GLANVEYLTVDEAFDLGKKPSHLIVLGAGSRGLEFAQAYARLGVDVTVIDEAPVLADADRELAAMVIDRLRADGIRIRDNLKVTGIARRRGGIRVSFAGEETPVDGSHLLVAGGRTPNINGLGLDVAKIAHDPG